MSLLDNGGKGDNKNTLIGIVVCVVFFLIYWQWFNKTYPDYNKEPQKTVAAKDPGAPQTSPMGQTGQQPQTATTAASPIAQDNSSDKSSGAILTEASAPIKRLTDEESMIKTDVSSYRLNQNLSSVDSVQLLNYRSDYDNGSGPVDLLDSPLVIQGAVNVDKNVNFVPKQNFQAERNKNRIVFSRQENDWLIKQEFSFPEKGYGADVVVSFFNNSKDRKTLDASVYIQEGLRVPKAGSFFSPNIAAQRLNVVSSFNGKPSWSDLPGYCSKDNQEPLVNTINDNIDFLGFDRHYFVMMLLPQVKKLSFLAKKNPANSIITVGNLCYVTGRVSQDFGFIEAGQTVEISFRSYFGPKSMEALSSFDPKMQAAIDLGWFDVIARPLLSAIKWLYDKTGNFGIAIIIMTLVFKLLFYPLTKQAAISAKKMKVLQPEMNRIKEQYKDNREIQQRELMKFMSTNKMNPMKGCLPVLPQIPVFFAFYSMLSAAIELRHAPFFLWIKDLSAQDPYYITPLLLGVAMFVQQKLTPMTGMDKTQERIMMFMPLMFTFMMLTLPSGLVIYMLTNSIVSIIQQQWLNRKIA